MPSLLRALQRKIRDIVWSGKLGQNPDTFHALATFNDSKLLHSYASGYTNKFGDYTLIRGKEGSLFAHGGRGKNGFGQGQRRDHRSPVVLNFVLPNFGDS